MTIEEMDKKITDLEERVRKLTKGLGVNLIIKDGDDFEFQIVFPENKDSYFGALPRLFHDVRQIIAVISKKNEIVKPTPAEINKINT